MKRTAISIVLAVAALAMLTALVLRSRALPLDVHLNQNTIANETASIADDFASFVGDLEAAQRELHEPGEATRAALQRLAASPTELAELIATIPATTAQSERLNSTFAAFTVAADEVAALGDALIERQTAYAADVESIRDGGPRLIEQMRELRLEEEAAAVFQLVVASLDYASPDGTVSASDLRQQLQVLGANERIDANMPRQFERLSVAITAMTRGKPALATALRDLSRSPLPQRAASVAASAGNAYRSGVARIEEARLMLSIYAVALLGAVALIGVRLQASYRALNRSNAELAGLNESLERRVTERTQELATTLHELQESQVQLVQAEKMSSLGQLVAGISHEINTPLLYLTNNAVLIQERLQSCEQYVRASGLAFSLKPDRFDDRAAYQAEFVARLKGLKRLLRQEDLAAGVQEAQDLAQDSIEGLADLTEMAQSLKDFSRLDRAPVASFDVNAGLDKTLTIARHVIKHKAEIRKFYGDLPEIQCGPSQINQVFLNLLTNAAQAIEGRGEIVITTKRQGDEHVAISIADTGCGIPPNIIEKIRDPFFTTKEVGDGTGLGLSIVDEIVRSHHGELHIDSQVGRGSVFTVVLPINRADRSEALAGLDELDELEPLDDLEADVAAEAEALAEAV